MDIPLYGKASPLFVPNYEPKAKRKLLVHKKELAKISSMLDKGYVMLPLEVYFNKRGLVKINVGMGKRLKKVEKKQILKEKDMDRQMKKDIKNL